MTSPQDLPKATHDEVEKIGIIQHQHGRKLNHMDQTLTKHTVRLESQTVSMDRANGRLDRMEEAQNEHTVKLDSHGKKLDELLGLLRQGK